MRKLFFTLLTVSITCFFSCNDGDIIDVRLDFNNDFSACEGVKDLVLYKTKSDPSESLSIVISNYSIAQFLAVGDDNTFTETKSGTLNYRTYSNSQLPNNLFCNDVPSSEINIINDYSSNCNVEIKTTLTEDDNDGIPAAQEDINGDGNLENDDTDDDGLPNYIDADDDGDNVLTKDENPDPNGDGDLSDAQNTDGEGLPDYLDPDDDGDGVNTRDEETESQDQNPRNDITNSDIGPDYLNSGANTNTPATKYRSHTIQKTYVVNAIVKGISLDILLQTDYDFGKLTDSNINSSLKSRTITPEFN